MKVEDVPREWTNVAWAAFLHPPGKWEDTSATMALAYAIAAVAPIIAAAERERIKNLLEGECSFGLSRAELAIRRAKEDMHASEQHHQEGRWHATNDLMEFAAAIRTRSDAP